MKDPIYVIFLNSKGFKHFKHDITSDDKNKDKMDMDMYMLDTGMLDTDIVDTQDVVCMGMVDMVFFFRGEYFSGVNIF